MSDEGWFEKEQGSGSVSEGRRTDKEKVLRSDHGSGSVSENRGGRIQDAEFWGRESWATKEKLSRCDHGSESVSESRGGRFQDVDFGDYAIDDNYEEDVMNLIVIKIMIMNMMILTVRMLMILVKAMVMGRRLLMMDDGWR